VSAFVCVLDRTGASVDPERLSHLAGALAAPADPGATELTTFHQGAVAIAVRHRRGADAVTGITADPEARRVTIARDPLGSLKVYFSLGPRFLVAASEAAALLRHDSVPDDPDEGGAARFLAFRFGWTDRTFFRAIRELPPGHRLEVTAEDHRIERYWRFRRPSRAGGRPVEALAAELRSLLGDSVARETASLAPERIALSLSGGLDSTAIAALAPPGVRAFSWTFREPALGDERSRVEAVSRHLGIPVEWVEGDGLHPLAGGLDATVERFVSAGSPYLNPFAALKHGLYTAAREAGCERVLVGDAGDALYAAREYWLRDALLARRDGLGSAAGSLAATLGRASRGDRFARLSLARVLPLTGLRTRLRGGAPPWLTPEGRAALPETAPSPILPTGGARHRHDLVAGARHTELESEEQHLFALAGVERGNPFWSWRLLEWALALPADLLHRDGRDKLLTRAAFRGRLPREVLEGGRSGLLGGLFLRGLTLARDEIADKVFRRPLSDWKRWVRPDWVEPYLPDGSAGSARTPAFGHTVLWRVIAYELWHRKRAAGGGGP
jgi:asparagine synthase (glutamine-hydrolysing)